MHEYHSPNSLQDVYAQIEAALAGLPADNIRTNAIQNVAAIKHITRGWWKELQEAKNENFVLKSSMAYRHDAAPLPSAERCADVGNK